MLTRLLWFYKKELVLSNSNLIVNVLYSFMMENQQDFYWTWWFFLAKTWNVKPNLWLIMFDLHSKKWSLLKQNRDSIVECMWWIKTLLDSLLHQTFSDMYIFKCLLNYSKVFQYFPLKNRENSAPVLFEFEPLSIANIYHYLMI